MLLSYDPCQNRETRRTAKAGETCTPDERIDDVLDTSTIGNKIGIAHMIDRNEKLGPRATENKWRR